MKSVLILQGFLDSQGFFRKKVVPGFVFLYISAILLCTLFICLMGAWKETDSIIVKSVNDDTFYYLLPAYNLAHGKGLSFDGIHQTNGFHPLWMIILSLLAKSAENREIFLHVSLSLCAVIFILAILVQSLFLYRLGGNIPSILGALIGCSFLLLGIHRQITINGLESAVYFFSVIIAMISAVHYLSETKGKRYVKELFIGISFGLLALSRIEFTVPGFIFILCVILIQNKAVIKNLKIKLFLPLFIFFVVVLPYFIWSAVTFGSIGTVSALTKKMNMDYYANELGGRWSLAYMTDVSGNFFKVTKNLFENVFDYFTRIHPIPRGNILLRILAFFTVIVSWILWRRKKGLKKVAAGILFIMGITSLGHLFFVSFIMPGYAVYNSWYFFLEYSWLILWFPLIWIMGFGKKENHSIKVQCIRYFFGIMIILFLTAVFAEILMLSDMSIRSHKADERYFQATRYYTALWLKDNLAPDVRIGSWNAGALGYFSHKTVINLDGLINDYDLYNWWKVKRNIWDYLHKERIQYIVDYAPRSILKDGFYSFGGWAVGCRFPKDRFESLYSRPMYNERNIFILKIKEWMKEDLDETIIANVKFIEKEYNIHSIESVVKDKDNFHQDIILRIRNRLFRISRWIGDVCGKFAFFY